jgi:hypothetical protein
MLKKNEVSKNICANIIKPSSVRNRLTDGHLASLLRVTASQLEPEYEKLLDTQSQFHLSHTPLYKGTKEFGSIKIKDCRNQEKLKYFIIIFSLLFQLTM